MWINKHIYNYLVEINRVHAEIIKSLTEENTELRKKNESITESFRRAMRQVDSDRERERTEKEHE